MDRGAAALCVAVSAFGLLLYAKPFHPIWFDEFLQFAPGGVPSFREAAGIIRTSILGLNHNQTGAYLLADYGLLQLFGASAFALRLPSILSAAWLLACAATFFGGRGFGNLWKLTGVMAILATGSLMDYTGEARPYMPLAAATVGTLTFYCIPARKGWVFAIGWMSIVLGALIHPYFLGYWIAMVMVGALLSVVEGRLALNWQAVSRFVDLKLVVGGVALYVGIGLVTWMRGAPEMEFDPFQFIPMDRLPVSLIDFYHLNMFYSFGPLFQAEPTIQRYLVVAIAASAVLALLLPARWRNAWWNLVTPATLLVGALLISAILSWISYRHQYWILGRQWIGSVPLVPIAIVWFFAELGRQADRWLKVTSVCFASTLLFVAGGSFVRATAVKWPVIVGDFWATPTSDRAEDAKAEIPACKDADRWVALANQNILTGGPVWPNLIRFYDCPLEFTKK